MAVVAAGVAAPAGADPGESVSATGHDGPGFPWRSGLEPRPDVFRIRELASPTHVARELLGARLVSEVGGSVTSGVIVETEAYLGSGDPASHAATRSGVTPRNRAMFGPAGHAYVYRSYGIHWCMNVVVGPDGEAGAVLLRGMEPLTGAGEMARRRGRDRDLASGPGRLCQALGISDRLYGHDLSTPPLRLLRGWEVADRHVGTSGRIGVSEAADWPLRFFVKGSPGVSR